VRANRCGSTDETAITTATTMVNRTRGFM
jgi:hypothetical protein